MNQMMGTWQGYQRVPSILPSCHDSSGKCFVLRRPRRDVPRLLGGTSRQLLGSGRQHASFRTECRPLHQQHHCADSASSADPSRGSEASEPEPCTAASSHRAQLLQRACAGAAAPVLSTTLGGTAIAAETGEVQAGEGPDLLTTVLFTATIAALVILTLGVLYLSATSFLDKRAESEARKKFDEAQKARELQAANVAKPKVKRRRMQDELSRGGGKGFGG